MQIAKLTLSIPKTVLDEAKVYSRKTHQPLSRLVSRYFSVLAHALSHKSADKDRITTKVRRLTGIAKSMRKDDDLLFEALSQKYKL